MYIPTLNNSIHRKLLTFVMQSCNSHALTLNWWCFESSMIEVDRGPEGGRPGDLWFAKKNWPYCSSSRTYITGVTGNWWCVYKSQCIHRRLKDCWAWSAWSPWSAPNKSLYLKTVETIALRLLEIKYQCSYKRRETDPSPKFQAFVSLKYWCRRFRNMDSSWNASPKPARSCRKLEKVWSEVDCWSFGMWTFGRFQLVLKVQNIRVVGWDVGRWDVAGSSVIKNAMLFWDVGRCWESIKGSPVISTSPNEKWRAKA